MSGTEQSTDAIVEEVNDLDAFSADFYGQKEVPVTETKVEAEQDTDEIGVVEDTDQEDDLELDDELPPAEKPKKQTVQDRINELVKQREDVKRESDLRLEQLRQEFEEKIAKLRPTEAKAEVKEPAPTDLNADGTSKYELGEFDPQYIRDLTRFTLDIERTQAAAKAEQEYQQRQAQESRQAAQVEWNGKVEAAKVEMPDFIEKGQALLSGLGNLPPEYGDYLGNVIMSMDHGPEVLYYLANNPSEARTIVNSGAQRATLALGRIEAKFVDAAAQKDAAKPKITKAPTPPTQRARGTNGAFITVAPDTDDLDAFSREFFKK